MALLIPAKPAVQPVRDFDHINLRLFARGTSVSNLGSAHTLSPTNGSVQVPVFLRATGGQELAPVGEHFLGRVGDLLGPGFAQ